ncbi:hypothetical protein ACFE04_012709 [Oxalis oulophora]
MSTISLPIRLSSPFLLLSSTHRRHYNKKIVKMSSLPESTRRSITLPSQLSEPISIIAGGGISESEFKTAVESSLFSEWLKNLQTPTGILSTGTFTLKQVLIQGVDMFGNRIGFLKFKADIFDNQTGQKIPGIVFARGPAVTVLILLESDGEVYAVLTEQARVPTGRTVLELPAGMLDDDKGDFVGTAVREVSSFLFVCPFVSLMLPTYKVEEEIGIKLKLEDMVDLTAFLVTSTGGRIFPSPGGCDEEISVFLYKGCVNKETITSLQGKEMGLRDHGEIIKVRVVPYEKLWRMTADAKVLMAIGLYEMAKREGLLPEKTVPKC